MDLKKHIRLIHDYPKKGILFRDITTLIKNEKAFAATVDLIVERSKKYKIDKIIGEKKIPSFCPIFNQSIVNGHVFIESQ